DVFFFSSRRRHTRLVSDWSSDVCSSDLLRSLVNKAFTPRVIEGTRARIQMIVDRLLDKVQDARSMDVIDDLAYPLPVTVICEMRSEERRVGKEWRSRGVG